MTRYNALQNSLPGSHQRYDVVSTSLPVNAALVEDQVTMKFLMESAEYFDLDLHRDGLHRRL